MSFRIDKQTINDIGIFGKKDNTSIYGIYNKTYTRGGAEILENFFLSPLSDEDKINKRGSIIKFFQDGNFQYPYQSEWFDNAEFYLNNKDKRSQLMYEDNTLKRKLQISMGTDTEYEQIHKGIISIIGILSKTEKFILELLNSDTIDSYRTDAELIMKIINNNKLNDYDGAQYLKKLSYDQATKFDKLYRYQMREKLLELFQYIYMLDVYMSVAAVSKERGFVFAKALPADENILKIENVYHPLLNNPIGNDISVDRNSNMIFLTGANMAGKSTFMKSFSIAIFLAHMGFPVPASSMKFSVLNGMFTTINLPDNLDMGYSHFYAEVLRVKKVAQSLGCSKNLIVVFDELFRGTNVKDAYDATVAVTEAFAENRNCIFIISTHIIEAGETLKKLCDNINFLYLPTVMDGDMPRYTYKIKSGITEDRHGMIIINNEKIIDILQ